jgi:pyrophosphatase PpaX
MKLYDCYLFDADGTLIDTTELIYRCFINTCRKFGGIEVARDLVISHIGLPLRSQLEVYLGPLSDERAVEVTKSHMDYQLSIYRDHLRVFPSVPEGLAALKAKGRRLAVVTSRRMESLQLYLRQCGIWEYFDVFVTPETTKRHKPHPEPAQAALRMLGCAPQDALFVGDAIWDIECGHDAGVDTAFVAWSATNAGSLLLRPTYLIRDLRELSADGAGDVAGLPG